MVKQMVIYMTSGPFHNIKLSQNVRIELNINFPQKIKKCKNMIFQNFFTLVPRLRYFCTVGFRQEDI